MSETLQQKIDKLLQGQRLISPYDPMSDNIDKAIQELREEINKLRNNDGYGIVAEYNKTLDDVLTLIGKKK